MKRCWIFHRFEFWPKFQELDLWRHGILVKRSRKCKDCGFGQLYAERIEFTEALDKKLNGEGKNG